MPGTDLTAAGEKAVSRKIKFKLPAGRFMIIFLIAAVLTGGFRVHFTGLGASDSGRLSALKRSGELKGFIYSSVWNKEDRMLFVNSGFKAVADVSALEQEVKDKLAAGAFVRITHYYIYESEPPRNPAIFNYRLYLLSRGVEYSVKIFADGIEFDRLGADNAFPGIVHLPGALIRSAAGNFLREQLGDDFGPLTAAVMTGDTGALDGETKENFRNGGVSHLMAVSGMHVAFVLLPMRALVRNRRTGFRARQLLLIIPVFLFIAIADFSSSVMRAGTGAIFAMVCSALERPPDRVNALCFSAGLQIFLNPYVVFGTGFLFSYTSVLSLIFIAPGVQKLFTSLKYRERRGIKKVDAVNVSALAAGISVNIALIPMSAYLFGSFSPVGLITTLYASPLAAAMCIGGYAFFICGLLDFIYILRPLKWFMKYALKLICRLISLIAGLGNALPAPIGRVTVPRPPLAVIIAVYAVMILMLTPARSYAVRAFLRIKERVKSRTAYKVAAVLAAAGIAVFICEAVITMPVIEALVIDVGQGSAMLVRAGGYAGLVDTGDGKTDIAEVVRAQGVNKLDFVVLSHGHNDHTGGFEAVLSEFGPATLFVSRDASASLIKAEKDAVNAGWTVIFAGSGDYVKLGSVSMSFIAADSFFGGRSDADENNASLCVVFSCAYGSLIAAGDLQKEGEEALSEKGAFPDIDILIAPHHGSASGSGSKMLSLTSPEYAIISVGRKNSYGHPSAEAIARLDGAGAEVFRTDSGGGISLVIRRRGLFGRKKVRVWQTL